MKHLYRVHPEEAAVIKESKAEKLRASVATPDLTAHEDQHTV